MGVGYAANSGYSMSVENVAKILGKDWNDFIKLLSEQEDEPSIDDVARQCQNNESYGDSEEIDNGLNKIYEKFKQITSVGDSHLEIEIAYYNPDDGDRYDEMEDGAFFWVSGNRTNTKAGEKFKEYIDYSNFVTFG